MFGNFSLLELLIVGAIALIVIGPKDLPRMMRSLGKFVGQARGLARQFQDSMNEAAREADLEEFREARKLLKGKSGVTDMLNEKMNLDDDEDDGPKPKKPAVLSSDDSKKLAEDSGFGAAKEEEPEPAMEPLAKANVPPPPAVDAKTG